MASRLPKFQLSTIVVGLQLFKSIPESYFQLLPAKFPQNFYFFFPASPHPLFFSLQIQIRHTFVRHLRLIKPLPLPRWFIVFKLLEGFSLSSQTNRKISLLKKSVSFLSLSLGRSLTLFQKLLYLVYHVRLVFFSHFDAIASVFFFFYFSNVLLFLYIFFLSKDVK